MAISITDPALLAALKNAGGAVQLHDAAGEVMGRFEPESPEIIPDDVLKRFPPMTAEELQASRKTGPGRTLQEVHTRIMAKLSCTN